MTNFKWIIPIRQATTSALTFPASFLSGDFSVVAAAGGATAVSAILINYFSKREKERHKALREIQLDTWDDCDWKRDLKWVTIWKFLLIHTKICGVWLIIESNWNAMKNFIVYYLQFDI